MAQQGQLLITKDIINDIWSVNIDLQREKLPEADKELVLKFGEPIINVGGTFGTDPNDYILPDKFIKIFSGLPYTQTFDSKSIPFDTNTATKVNSWVTAFESTYTDAVATLRASEDTFTGQVIFSF